MRKHEEDILLLWYILCLFYFTYVISFSFMTCVTKVCFAFVLNQITLMKRFTLFCIAMALCLHSFTQFKIPVVMCKEFPDFVFFKVQINEKSEWKKTRLVSMWWMNKYLTNAIKIAVLITIAYIWRSELLHYAKKTHRKLKEVWTPFMSFKP